MQCSFFRKPGTQDHLGLSVAEHTVCCWEQITSRSNSLFFGLPHSPRHLHWVKVEGLERKTHCENRGVYLNSKQLLKLRTDFLKGILRTSET